MEMGGILINAASLGGIALLVGVMLIVASIKFKVEEDERLPLILDVLPSANCGGCGYAGCGAFAEALVVGNAGPSDCPVGGTDTAQKVADILGIVVEEKERQTAFIKCIGSTSTSLFRYDYAGMADCGAMSQLAGGGSKSCAYGCLGGGSCEKACDFGAVDIQNGIAVINKDKCVACSKCIAACPKNLIEIIPHRAQVTVGCVSQDNGKVVKSHCQIGCIGCKMCAKACEVEAIEIENMFARIDYSKCTGCNACAQKCPTTSIRSETYVKPAKAESKAV